MFRILQLCNKAPYPANDGSSIAIYNMSQGLVGNGAELYLLTINTRKHFKPDDQVPEAFKKSTHYQSVYRNTNTSMSGALVNLFSSSSYFVSRFYFREFDEALTALLKQTRFDIIQLEGLFMGVYLDTIKAHSSAKVVLRAHNLEHFIWERHLRNEKNPLLKQYLTLQNKRLKKFELQVMRRMDAIVPITQVDEKAFRRLGFQKPVYTCITGVDVKRYQEHLAAPVKTNTVFYFGSMDWLPNQEAVLWFLDHCWPLILRAVPEARFLMAGRGMPPEFHHLSRPNVLVIENVVDSKVFFHQHEVMVVPLLSGSGLRIKIIEGMAYGKAIVSTTVGAEGIAYTDQQNICIADTPAAFAAAVIELLHHAAKRQRLEQNAASFAMQEFDNLGVVAGLVDFYKQLLA